MNEAGMMYGLEMLTIITIFMFMASCFSLW